MKQDNKFVRSLIQNAQHGKIVSLEELFRMNVNRIYAIILRMSANKSLASIIGFNVLIKVWKGIREFPDDISFRNWMINIAVKTTFEELKTGNLVKDKKFQKQINNESGVEEFLNVPLEKAISELEYESRSLIVMNRIEHLSFNEITELTGISEDETKEYLVKGVGKISRVFAEIKPETASGTQIEDLPKEIEPDRDIVQFTINKIREVKEEEFKEEDVEFEEIENLPKHKIEFKKEKSEKREFRFNKKYSIIGLVLLVIITAVYYLNLKSNVWTVSTETGTAFLNDKPITKNEIVSDGDIVTTEASSFAKLNIESLAEIEITPGSSIKRLEDNNTAKLVNGKLNISTKSENEYLFIEVPSAVVEGYFLSNDYSVSIDEQGNVVVEVTYGWLQVVSGEDVSIVPEGYVVTVLSGSGLSIPAAIESHPSLSLRLDEYLFAGNKIEVLNSILDMAVKSETITLWNLLKRVIPNHRELVYEKLNSLVLHPKSVSKSEVLKLNDEMLNLWLEEIEWVM